jgi:hypothetical protein
MYFHRWCGIAVLGCKRWRWRWTTMMTQTRSAPVQSVVLVIDDDYAVRNSLKFALEIEGFSVQVYPC